jgi:hypothetical protein
VSRYPIAVVIGVGLALAAPAGQATAALRPGSTVATCSAASYKPVRTLSYLHDAPRVTFFRRLTIAPHTVKRHITWSAPAKAPVIARAVTVAGATVTATWVWPAVARHVQEPVASAGQRTPRIESSGHQVFTVPNHSARVRHDVLFNAVIRLDGRFLSTRCADPNSKGVGRVHRTRGSWVTFVKVPSLGEVECGHGSGGDAIAKAVLTHCP